MTKTELEKKFEGVKDINGLVETIRNESDSQVILDAFKKHGLDISEEDVTGIDFGDEEINENQLEMVAGGCSCGGWLQHVVWKFLNWAIGKKVGCM